MSLPCSYFPNYYSIEDILTTQERVPCKVLQSVPNMGKLDSSSESDNLEAGTELELPLWLAITLKQGRKPIVAPSLPKIYKEAYREILKADPNAVDLHKFNLYFYDLGNYVKNLDAQAEVQQCLEQTFQKRFRQLLDLSECKTVDPVTFEKLDMMERRLFADAHEAKIKLHNWLVETRSTLKAADMVINHKKRKRIELETQ